MFRRSDVERGVEWWESHGYRVELAEGVFSNDDWVAGAAERRARDLEALFADPEVDAVQVFRGGYGSAQLIPFLDFGVVAANPKPFVGFSDITALHESIRQRTGLATFYGPGLYQVGRREASDLTREQLLAQAAGRGGRGAPRARRPVRARDRGRPCLGDAGRRLPLAARADDGDAVGVRRRRGRSCSSRT